MKNKIMEGVRTDFVNSAAWFGNPEFHQVNPD